GDPKYHVNKSTWDAIMSNHDLNKGDYNFTVSYTNILGGNSVLKVDNSKFEFVSDPSMYLERTGEDKYSIYNYDSNQQYWNVNSNVELGADYFDDSFGVLPIAFEDMSFGSESTYYYKSAYRYYPDKENDPTNYVDYSNIRVYFEDNKLQQISYVVMGSTKSFVYSAHNTTTVTLPTQTTPIDVTQYLPELQNKVFTFDSYSGSGEAAVMSRVYAGSKVSIFNDYSAEFFLAHTYNGTDVLDVEICLFGGITLRENSYNANNGDPYVVGDFRVTSMAYDGVPNSQTQTFYFRYFVNSKKVRVQVESGEYLFFNLSDQTPEHYEIETPVGAQWPSEAVSSYLTKIGSTSVVPPLEGALSYMNMESEGMLLVSCMFGSADAMNAAYATYTTTLLRTFEYNQTYQWYFDAQIVIMLQKNADANSISVVIMENPFPTPASGYPETEINAFITNNSITDSVPDFRYENAIFMTLQATDTSYSFMVTPPNGVTSATLFGYYNNMLNASESFTLINQGENGYVYVSATSQYYVIIADNEGTVLVNLVYNDSPYIYYYPADKISSFFTGVTDQYYDFSIKSAVAYSFEAADEEADLNYAVLNIYFDEEEDVESVAAGYIGGLQTLGYGLKTGETYGEMYVSPNKEIGFAFEVYESGISIRLYNLKKHSDNFTVNYTLYNTNDWNIYDANPQFYAWVFGGKYGMGEWIELNQVTDEEGHRYFTLEGIDDSATGMNIVRFAADSAIGRGNEEGVRIFNQTSNISLTSNNTVISFSFNG
ncbi:MAG: hypothetical protein J6X03_03670, partial [Bacilli bacterium]|nr:hypothetical protein [Bacilli bacterium]